MEKRIVNECFVVGWSTRGKHGLAGNVYRYSRRFPEFDEANAKFIAVQEKDRTIYAYIHKRIEYEDNAVRIVRIDSM